MSAMTYPMSRVPDFSEGKTVPASSIPKHATVVWVSHCWVGTPPRPDDQANTKAKAVHQGLRVCQVSFFSLCFYLLLCMLAHHLSTVFRIYLIPCCCLLPVVFSWTMKMMVMVMVMASSCMNCCAG